MKINKTFYYKCGLVQLNSRIDIDNNIEQASQRIDEAVGLGADLVCLPECTPYLGPDSGLIKNIDQIEKILTELLDKKSKEHGVTITAGGYRKSTHDNKAYNCLFWSDTKNKTKVAYDKIHLFDVNIPDGVQYKESDTIKKGSEKISILTTKTFGKITPSICYDLRFPEHYRNQTQKGANTILIPSAFTKYTGQQHWEVLIRARAIENLSYVIAPAQTGTHYGKRESWGHSMIVDPWGNIIGNMGAQTGVIVVTIDENEIINARAKIPSCQQLTT